MERETFDKIDSQEHAIKWTRDEGYDARVTSLVLATYDANRQVESYVDLPGKVIRALFTLTYVRTVNVK